MSLDINVYTKTLSDILIPGIVDRLNGYDMVVEVDPGFSFEGQTGFLPFRFRLKNPHLDVLKNRELISGFELYIDDFDLIKAKRELQPKSGFFEKVFGKKKEEIPFASPEIESRLLSCKKVIRFVWHASDSFELRFASLTSAILTELTGGVCSYPADDIWYDNKNIAENAFKEINAYEHSLTARDIVFREFETW